MRAEHRNLKWTLALLFLGGVFCSSWNVGYQPEQICAVKGSSVVILCSFSYPETEKVRSLMWAHGRYNFYNGPFIWRSGLKNISSRYQYIGDTHHNCSFEIHQVEHNDSGKYAFRFITHSKGGMWTGRAGSTLKIVDLNISVTKLNSSEIMKEGDSVNLTCVNGCDGGNLSSAFTWFKNGEAINEGPVLYLTNMSSANSGNYTCSLKTHSGTSSGVVHIDVEYGPKNTSASVAPSAEVEAGSNVTLICSSHANPPVENYTWFKIHSDDVTAVGHHPEQRFKAVSKGDVGQYLCSAANKHGNHNSSVVTLKIKVYWTTFTRDVLVIISACVATLLIAITAVAVRSRKRTATPEAGCEEDKQSADYANWPMFLTNQSEEGSRCEEQLIYTAVFNTKRESDVVQQVDSRDEHEHVIYSTVCR